MAYQSFGNEKGDSDSAEKLARLSMPARLDGRSFLDIGCNEGFFCIAAYERGATRVVGIDSNHTFVGRARVRTPHIEYLERSWDDLPPGQFDVILMSSALHYASDPRRLLSNIRGCLSDGGLFILEAGVVANSKSGEKNWVQVQRGSDTVSFPNWSLLTEDLLSDFAVRIIGTSVAQAGDPVSRFVFHCQKLKPIVMLCPGQSGIGKTTLATELSRKGVSKFSTDAALLELAESKYLPVTPLYAYIREKFNSARIGGLIMEIIDLGMGQDLADALFKMFPKGERIAVIEGHAISHDAVQTRFVELLRREHKVWRLAPDDSFEAL